MELGIALAVGLMIGVIIGRSVTIFLNRKRMAGTLRMDHSDPSEAPFLFLEVEPGGMEIINREKVVFFKVDLNSYLSRK